MATLHRNTTNQGANMASLLRFSPDFPTAALLPWPSIQFLKDPSDHDQQRFFYSDPLSTGQKIRFRLKP
jgi:hypothetical protein